MTCFVWSLIVLLAVIENLRGMHRSDCTRVARGAKYGGNMRDLVFARNCSIARMLPGEAELVSEWTGLPGEAKSVKRFERSNGPDTALYKNYRYLYLYSLAVEILRSRSYLFWSFPHFFETHLQFSLRWIRVGTNTAFIICVLMVMLISLCPRIGESWKIPVQSL